MALKRVIFCIDDYLVEVSPDIASKRSRFDNYNSTAAASNQMEAEELKTIGGEQLRTREKRRQLEMLRIERRRLEIQNQSYLPWWNLTEPNDVQGTMGI